MAGGKRKKGHENWERNEIWRVAQNRRGQSRGEQTADVPVGA